MKLRKACGLLVGAAALVLNPALFACGDSGLEDEGSAFQFTEEEMRHEVEGTFSGTIAFGDQVESFTLTLEQAADGPGAAPGGHAGAPALQPLCGDETRTFVKPAAACATLYSTAMAVGGLITSDGGTYDDDSVEGWFVIQSTDLSSGFVTLNVLGDQDVALEYSDGRFVDGGILHDTLGRGTISLDAVP